MIEMEPNKIYTIRARRPLTRGELRRRMARDIRLVAAIIIWVIVTLLCVFSSGSAAPERAPEQTTGKLETTVISRVALLTPIETTVPEQVSVMTYGCISDEKTHVWDVPLTDEDLATLLEACEAGGIPVEVGLGLIQIESGFDPAAVNPKSKCYGYCQINPRYFSADLDAAGNIRTGMAYLAEQLERYDGDMEAALTAYNAGYDTGDRTYADMVLEAAEAFKVVEVSK